MADATATALRGQVRTQRRAVSRGCWRLVVLLGLAWVAIQLLGGAAQAVPAGGHHRDTTDDVRRHAVPLIGQVLSRLDTAAHPRSIQPASTPTPAPAPAPVSSPKPALPVAQAVDTVKAVADVVRDTATATASTDSLADVRIPSTTDLVAPAISGITDQVDATVQSVANTVTQASVALPVARPLAGVLRATAGAVDVTTDRVVEATAGVTGSVDTVIDRTTRAIAPVLHAVSSPVGSIVITGSGANPAPGSGDGQTGLPAPEASATNAPVATGTPTTPRQLDVLGSSSDHGGPAVPPPDAASTHLVAQPAADIVTSVSVPVSGAGSTTGNGGSSAPAPSLDQTLVRVDESEPAFADEATEPIDGPTGPMPGTPSADPAFSPD